MQLRVARLCLDCEELFVGDTCPICASQRFAFLSTWLPVDERRRWRRQPPKPEAGQEGFLQTAKRFFARWTGGEIPEPETRTLRTRASDNMPRLDFEGTDQEPGKQPVKPTELVRETGKTFE
jgi:hypothetical protein